MLAVVAADSAPKLTQLDVALPFFVAAVLVVIGAAFEEIVKDKVAPVLEGWAKQTGDDLGQVGDTFQPESMAQMSGWTIETAQVVPTVLAPLVGLVLLWKQGARGLLVLALLAILFVAVVAFVLFLKRPSYKYGSGWPWIFTPLTMLALVLNLAGAGIAALIGPYP